MGDASDEILSVALAMCPVKKKREGTHRGCPENDNDDDGEDHQQPIHLQFGKTVLSHYYSASIKGCHVVM
jgi:hypothetical protein